MLATAKLVACLAAVSTLECKGSAQATDHHEGNNLPAPPPTVPEIPTVQSTDSALLTTDEDRMLEFPHGIPPLRMKNSLRASRLPVSPHTDQAKLEDLQRASLLEKKPPLIALLAEKRLTFYPSKHPNVEALSKHIRKLARSGTARSRSVRITTRSKKITNDDKEIIMKAFDEAVGEYRIELEQRTMEWWKLDESPAHVLELLGNPPINTMEHNVYRNYKVSYYDHQARLGFAYITWFRRKADPADVLKILSEMFPGYGEMMTMYHSEYKKLFEEYSDMMEKLPEYLNGKKVSTFEQEWTQKRYDLQTLDLLRLMRSASKWERNRLSWMEQKMTPDEVFASLEKTGWDLAKSQKYLSFLMYRDWWIFKFPDKAVELWMQKPKELKEVLALLKLDSLTDSELSVHPMYPYYLKYRNWWIVKFPDKAVESWKKEKLKSEDVAAVLQFLEESDYLKMLPHYEYFANWLAAEATEKWLRLTLNR